jgi:hypothetical protein
MLSMNKSLGLMWAGLFVLASSGTAMSQDWRLVWSDEFDSGVQPDQTRWSYDVGGGGWGNQEFQYYTDSRPQNSRVQDGLLIIEAIKEDFFGSTYTSARLRTKGQGDWLYGRVEVRAKLPAGLGTWPAIWMLASESHYGDGGWPDNGEIDIMEGVGHEPDRTHSAIHVQALNHQLNNNPGATFMKEDSRTGFAVYAMDWTPRTITTYVDGEVNLAVGGSWGGIQGVDPNDFPTRFEIDYVRVFEDAAGPPEVSVSSIGGLTQVDPGESLSLSAAATDAASTIEELALYQRDGLLAFVQEGQVSVELENLAPGCYQIRADAVDSDGWEAGSDTLNVQVGTECVQAPYLMVAPLVPGRVEAEYFDIGGAGEAYLDLSSQNTGGALRADEGVDIGSSQDIGGGYQIENVTLREWTEYTVNVTQSGFYRMSARLAATKDGSLTISVDDVEHADPLTYSSTNSTSFHRNAVLDGLWLDEGIRTVRVEYNAIGAYVNRFEFRLLSATGLETLPESSEMEIDVFPNPFQDRLELIIKGKAPGPSVISMYDVTGRRVFHTSLTGHKSTTNHVQLNPTERMSPGLYLVVIQSDTDTYTTTVIRR